VTPDVRDIDVGTVQTSGQLHDLLADRLRFFDGYGRNWDAFWDCLNDPALSSLPDVLVVRGWADLAQRLPGDANQLRTALDDLHLERPEVAVEWK
jgi:ribonuclease inhibitor